MARLPRHRLAPHSMCTALALAASLLAATAAAMAASDSTAAQLKSLDLPPGFSIALYINATLSTARSLAVSGASKEGGPVITYVGSKTAGKVYALVDRQGDGTADTVTTLISGVDSPNGVAWRGGSIYVSGFAGGKGMVWRYDGADAAALAGKALGRASAVVTSALPGDTWHGVRFMRFGPDGLLYIGVGDPCNVCAPANFTASARGSPTIPYGSIVTLNVDSGAIQTWATGIRNTVGFDWHPNKKTLMFTDNGRDELGDNQPDDTLHVSDRRGTFHGFPYCLIVGQGDPYRRNVGAATVLPDPDLNKAGSAFKCSNGSFVKALQPMGPHVAALGMRFYTGAMFPPEYRNGAIIAQHGSWNRKDPIGYQVMVLKLDGSLKPASYQPLVTGWLPDSGASWGRPVDVQELPDGSLLVSDDAADRVYRVTYG